MSAVPVGVHGGDGTGRYTRHPTWRLDIGPLVAGRPTAVLGHRGRRGGVRENTVAAFEAAAREGADGVELDVRATRDGVLVVHHDAAVEGAVLSAVDHLEAAARWPWIPTLDDALDACSGLLVNVEIKNDPRDPDFDPEDRVGAGVAAVIARRAIRDETIVSSFYPPTVAKLRELDPALRTGQLLSDVDDPVEALGAVVRAGHQAIHPWVGSLGGSVAAQLVDAAHAAGLWVLVWTVNEPDDLRRLAEAGVDAVIVDDPAAACSVVRP